MGMSLRENITAVIETCFSETKEEIQEVAIDKILELIRTDKADRKDEPQTETKTETQNSNLTFEKRTMLDCYNCKRYETEEECIECRYESKDEPQTERSE